MMQTSALASPDTVDSVIRLLSWGLFVFAALWAVTGTIGYFHRRAYNLTRAESDRSKNIKPDFLTVDKAKRQAAIERGEAYGSALDRREAASPAETVSLWSRMAAMTTAVLALVSMIIGTFTKVDQLQAGFVKLSSWDRFSQLVSENKAGTVVALVVIGANVIVFAESSKKWRKARATVKP